MSVDWKARCLAEREEARRREKEAEKLVSSAVSQAVMVLHYIEKMNYGWAYESAKRLFDELCEWKHRDEKGGEE